MEVLGDAFFVLLLPNVKAKATALVSYTDLVKKRKKKFTYTASFYASVNFFPEVSVQFKYNKSLVVNLKSFH